ncbi:amino acid adenylation domain-containing protein [Sodalis sp. dw_96]|uniref:amino acid adenylation domain-containing protein n=1 Tax=Sodalis sp. dw_96 TaxID=2719794 RepID=UPI001BD4FA6C|nr:amino acid adenylation domain-containing protein [Sodalis sp. dw_96]
MSTLLHDGFHRSVDHYPNTTAIVDEYQHRTTYRLLNRKANLISAHVSNLSNTFAVKNNFIGILSHVNVNGIASILGILKAKKTYVPIDPYYPAQLLIKVITNLDLDILLVDRPLLEQFQQQLPHCNLKYVLVIEADAFPRLYTFKDGAMAELSAEAMATHASFGSFESIERLEPNESLDTTVTLNQVSDDLAYILHTSGSTGVPKGIMLSHRNAMTFVDWMQKEFRLTQNDRIISRAPLKFDLSVFDIFNTLSVGATLICYDWNKRRDDSIKHRDYVTLLENEKATMLYTTPSTLLTLMEKGQFLKSKNHLRTIMYAGEPFPVPKLEKLKKRAPYIAFANIYGPTETNIITYHWVQEDDFLRDSIPLGKVVDDTEIIVVNVDTNKICDANETGELWCRGGTVTHGYINQPELTAKHYILSPFHPYPVRYWRTGDYGYLDNNGELHYKGRRDHMYKINGYRVEIGDIEAAVASLEEIHELCITISKSGDKNGIICHFSLVENACFNDDSALARLKNLIPSYMLPNVFLEYKELPKTSSGKIDRVLLNQFSA